MFTVLIAEDEARIRRLVSDFLKREDYRVLEAADGVEALEVLEENRDSVQLVLLDVMMPRLDGFRVLETIKRRFPALPVILLTALGEEADELKGFERGAIDYITKPFSPLVLVARVRAVESRLKGSHHGVHVHGDLTVDDNRREVRVKGEIVSLTPKEYDLLSYFCLNQGLAISREKILNAVWGYDYFGDLRAVDTHIKKLRAKLGACGRSLVTVRGYGYRFEVEP